jgi:hypothetical protein
MHIANYINVNIKLGSMHESAERDTAENIASYKLTHSYVDTSLHLTTVLVYQDHRWSVN